MKIDQAINTFFEPISDFVFSVIFFSIPIGTVQEIPFILIWLSVAALFFTFYFGFINLRYFKHAIDVVRGKYDDPEVDDGQISRFQALATSLSGTVGLGNIAGVAVAVSLGGPGAVFWMVLMALFSMSTKFTEVALGVKYRHHPDPERPEKISGGPMYYLRDAFANRGISYAGPVIAGLFAVFCICGSIGGGNMFQANQAYQQALQVTGGEAGFLGDKGWIFGVGLAFMVGIVIIGGIQSIAGVASRLVPAMGGIYLLAGLVVIGMNYTNVPAALVTIFQEAFTPEAGIGGVIGGLLVGVQRAAFSNEAGLGSAAIVHSTARTDDHISQGFVGMLGPFIDTVIICLVTALVIVISGVYQNADGVAGVSLTSQAMESAVSWFPYVLALTVFLFAYSTMIAWYYYGEKALTYLTGEKRAVTLIYKIFFCLCIIVGTSAQLDSVIAFTDAMILSMAFPNIIGLYLLAPEIKRDLRKYIEKLQGIRAEKPVVKPA